MVKHDLYHLPPEVLRDLGQHVLRAAAEVQRLDSEFHARVAEAQWSTIDEWANGLEEYLLKRFDLCADQLLWVSDSPDPMAINALFGGYLDKFEDRAVAYASEVLQCLRSDLREDAISKIALKLSARKLLWLAEAKQRKAERPPEPKTANGAQEFAKTIATSRMKKRRSELVRRKRTGMTMADFARNVGKSTTAIYGMIKGDTTRFNAEALTDFLKRTGTTPEEWNRE
jgi:hypothetical protein